MKNNQQEPDTKTIWGLKKTPLTHKLKEERTLDTVNRVITRIQNTKRIAYGQTSISDLLEDAVNPQRVHDHDL